MTVAVLIKVNDGVVFAADSATALGSADTDGSFKITNIYNNANKIFNLHKQLPIGAMTWGLGNIGPASISSLAKDFRRQLTANGDSSAAWRIDPDSYTIKEIADHLKTFIFDQHYTKLVPADAGPASLLGLMVGGYSAGEQLPEAYLLQMSAQDGCSDPILIHPQEDAGASWWGQPEAITRLMNGVSSDTAQALVNLGVPATDAPGYTRRLIEQLRQTFVQDGMPIQDAIDLAAYLVDTTIKFVRFSPGDATVGGPIEVAAVTKHEGFKWIARKHYFTSSLNPEARETQ